MFINIAEMWKLKQKIWPKRQESLPTGKFNNQGQIVTDTKELKNLYVTEFKERLGKRPCLPDFLDIQNLKNSIFELKMEQVKANRTKDWTIQELDDVLKSIQSGKSKDPEGIDREIFYPSMIGKDLRDSLLAMFNQL